MALSGSVMRTRSVLRAAGGREPHAGELDDGLLSRTRNVAVVTGEITRCRAVSKRRRRRSALLRGTANAAAHLVAQAGPGGPLLSRPPGSRVWRHGSHVPV